VGLDSVELVIAFEHAFGIDIPDADASRLSTVGAVTDFVDARLQAAGRPWERARIFAMVRTLTVDQLGVRPDQLTEATRFVEDLGLD
jgi:acyl carrier protein